MRAILENLLGKNLPDHLGLAYDRWAPLDLETGKIPNDRRGPWLAKLRGYRISSHYRYAYERWLESLRADGSRAAVVTMASRLLVGHGSPAPTEIGLTVHHTWSVPVIPGSALKGLLNHFIDAVYGPDELGVHPMSPSLSDETRERARFRGVTWDEKRHIPLYGPGEVHRALFGAPMSKTDEHFPGSGETIGGIVFHDALFVPGSAGDRPFAEDVLTVHQKQYYDKHGREGGPNDYDAPIPISFLTVKPGAQFLLALSGPPEWTDLALRELRGALMGWGVGGKTAAGYGQIMAEAWTIVAGSDPPAKKRAAVDAFQAWLTHQEPRPSQRTLLERFTSEWLPRRQEIGAEERQEIGRIFKKEIKSPKLGADRDRLLAEWHT